MAGCQLRKTILSSYSTLSNLSFSKIEALMAQIIDTMTTKNVRCQWVWQK